MAPKLNALAPVTTTASGRALLGAASAAEQRQQLQIDLSAIATSFNERVRKDEIVGVLSAAGNGRIVESGTNANGYFVKFADGTMICATSSLVMPATAINTGNQVVWNFPAVFSNLMGVFVTPVGQYNGGGGQQDTGAMVANGLYMTRSASNVILISHAYRYAISTGVSLQALAIGRWF